MIVATIVSMAFLGGLLFALRVAFRIVGFILMTLYRFVRWLFFGRK